MIRIASWFIIVFPFLGLYLEGRISFLFAAILAGCTWLWCAVMWANRPANRTPIHTIFVRMVLTVWIPFGVLMWWLQSGPTGIPTIFTFWEVCYTSFVGVAGFVALFWGATAIARYGTSFGTADSGLHAWEQLGGHYFWDLIPWPWNPDSYHTRNGGGWVQQAPSASPSAPPSTTTSVPPGYAPVQTRRKK